MGIGLLKVPWFVWGLLSLAIAVVFVFFVPAKESINATGNLRYVILRWFHSVCWLLIGLSFFMRHGENLAVFANPVAMVGGVVYLVFLVNFVQVTSR